MASSSQLSFLPDDYLERKAQRRMNAICAVLFLLVVGGLVSAFAISEKVTKAGDEEYNQVNLEYVAEAQRIEQVREMQEKQRRMAHQAELTASLLERVPRSFILAEITNSLPSGVSLMDLALDSKVRVKPAPAGEAPKTAYEQHKAARQAAAGTANAPASAAEAKLFDVSLTITGLARTDVQVAQFLNRLGRSPLMRDVNLTISEEHKQGEEKLRKFEVSMMLNPEARASSMEKARQTVSVEVQGEN